MAQSDPSFEARNREFVEEFIDQLPSLSLRRIQKYRHRMHRISMDLAKPFDQVTKEDLRTYVQKVNDSPNYTDWTKLDYRIFLKKFFAWMHDREWVAWIRLSCSSAMCFHRRSSLTLWSIRSWILKKWVTNVFRSSSVSVFFSFLSISGYMEGLFPHGYLVRVFGNSRLEAVEL